MTSTLVDSNILLDLSDDRSKWVEWSAGAVEMAEGLGPMIINVVVYSEASVLFANPAEFEEFAPPSRYLREAIRCLREAIPTNAAFIAGKRHLDYRKRGGVRSRTLPDFLIGAHALVQRYRLLTRDAARYRSYCPELYIIAPDTHP